MSTKCREGALYLVKRSAKYCLCLLLMINESSSVLDVVILNWVLVLFLFNPVTLKGKVIHYVKGNNTCILNVVLFFTLGG